MRRDERGQAFQPRNPLPLGAEPGVEGDVVQARQAGVEAGLAVQVPEMARIGEARAQRPLRDSNLIDLFEETAADGCL